MRDGLYVGAGLCIAAAIGLDWLKIPVARKRRLYWYLTSLTSLFFFISAYPNVRLGLGLIAFVFFGMTLLAFRYTPYVRINGATYAWHVEDANADAIENPGLSTSGRRRRSLEEWLATPRGTWWFIAGLWVAFDIPPVSMALRGDAGSSHDRIMILSFLLFLVLFSAGVGFVEAVNEYPTAQGQWLQFIIATICSAGLFAVLYLTAYHATILVRERRDELTGDRPPRRTRHGKRD